MTTLAVLGAIALIFYVPHLGLYDLKRAERHHDLEDQVLSRTVELRRLAGYLLTAQEDEKAHLARELHDELGGVLTGAKLVVARMRRGAAADPVVLDRIEQLTLYRFRPGSAEQRQQVRQGITAQRQHEGGVGMGARWRRRRRHRVRYDSAEICDPRHRRHAVQDRAAGR